MPVSFLKSREKLDIFSKPKSYAISEMVLSFARGFVEAFHIFCQSLLRISQRDAKQITLL